MWENPDGNQYKLRIMVKDTDLFRMIHHLIYMQKTNFSHMSNIGSEHLVNKDTVNGVSSKQQGSEKDKTNQFQPGSMNN